MPEVARNPLIQLERNASAPVLRYDIPEPTSYGGTNLIQLNFDGGTDIFRASLLAAPQAEAMAMLSGQPTETVKSQIKSFLAVGASSSGAFGSTGTIPVGVLVADTSGQPVPPPVPEPPGFPVGALVLDDLAQKVKLGERLVVDENVNGDTNVTTVPVPAEPEPRLYLVETLRMTSFLGDYGAGRVVKTFSLLPGESTKVSIKTFKQRESTAKHSSSVLDSVTKESADDLQRSLQEEQSDQSSYQKSKEYYADVKAKASWGWGSASAKAGVKGSTNSTRQEAVKNISNATEKHTSKASAKREVEVNTAFEVTEKEGEETSIEREVENINVSRTLNFVFRQMNQAFISFVHITDIRVGYFDGRRESRIEVPISQLDSLMDAVVKKTRAVDVKAIILEQLRNIRDFDGNLVDVVKEVPIDQNDAYLTFDAERITDYTDPATQRTYAIPGVLMAVNSYVMRTEGVIVESILGEGIALDEYAAALQDMEVKRRSEEVRVLKASADQAELLNSLVSSGNSEKTKLLAQLTCPCGAPSAKTETDTGEDV